MTNKTDGLDAELVATDMRCVAWQERQMFKDGWSDWYPSGARLADQPKERVLDQIVYQWRPVFSPEQLAAARLQGAREEPVNAGLAKLAHTQALRIKELEQASAVNQGLLEACKTFCEWLDREERGFAKAGEIRETPEGESKWREWYYGNIALCGLAQEQARAAIAASEQEKTK